MRIRNVNSAMNVFPSLFSVHFLLSFLGFYIAISQISKSIIIVRVFKRDVSECNHKGLLHRSGKSITEGPRTPDTPPQQAGETNGQTDRQTDKQADGQTD